MPVTLADVRAARERIASFVPATPTATSDHLCRQWNCRIWFKLEMLHATGSFKERGALSKLLTLTDEEKKRGVIAASAGNHAQALAYHASRLGIPSVILMPTFAPLIKVQNTASYGAEVILQGDGYDDALAAARQLAEERNLTFVHGFDDPAIMAGQGTLALEMLEQCGPLDVFLVPVGGGGLIAGIAAAVKELHPDTRIIGVQSEAVPSLKSALEHGSPVTVPGQATIADGISVRRVGTQCLQVLKEMVDEVLLVSEEEIASAVLLMLEREKAVVEGAGAAGVAALLAGKVNYKPGATVGAVLSGGNIDVNRLSRIIDKGLVKDGRLAKLRVLVHDRPGQLSAVLASLADSGANILEIQHDRAFSAARVGETCIDLTLETRGEEHLEQVIGSLVAKGHQISRRKDTGI